MENNKKTPEEKIKKGTESITAPINIKAMFKISYGLFLLTAKDGKKDNGCIVNTVIQITESPRRILVAVSKANCTHDQIKKTGKFMVSMLSTAAPFSIFERFGFQSGKEVEKFENFTNIDRGENGLYYLTKEANSYIGAEVIDQYDYESHTLFIASVTEAQVLNEEESMTYSYYFANVKPKPVIKKDEKPKKGFICTVCGFVYEGDTLPGDYICPICKHTAEVFEPL